MTVEDLRELRPLLPAPFFHVHDGAMMSEPQQGLLTELGIILVNRTRAEKNPKVAGKRLGQGRRLQQLERADHHDRRPTDHQLGNGASPLLTTR